MARWYVVTEGPKVPVDRVVWEVLGREDLEDGRVRWLVDAPDFAKALPSCFRGFLAVDPVPSDEPNASRNAR